MKAVIFDLDGVIVSTDVFHTFAWREMAEEQGIPFDEELSRRLKGVGRLESAALILKSAGRNVNSWDVYAFAQMKNLKYVDYLSGLSSKDILPGIPELLNDLKAADIRMAIASSSKNAGMILEKTGLTEEFDVIVDGTMIKYSKPDPEVFLKASELLNIPPEECVVIEDSEAGIQGARRGGMFTVAVGSAAETGCGDLNVSGQNCITAEMLLTGTKQMKAEV